MPKQNDDRMVVLAQMIISLSMSGQPCDVTFFNEEPILHVTIDEQINLALMYGAGPKRLKEILDNIKLSNGRTVSIGDIWMVFPMPREGLSQQQLAAVNLVEGEEKHGPNEETIREMIGNCYHCKSKDDEERFLRRYLAS